MVGTAIANSAVSSSPRQGIPMNRCFPTRRPLRRIAVAALALAAGAAVQAQSSSPSAGSSALPWWVGRAPIGPVSVFAKAGGTYGRTEVTADLLSGVSSGKDSGTGVSVGAGIGYDINQNSSVVVEYGRHDVHFVGVGREPVELTSLVSCTASRRARP
jgi:Outer membrane protein beta-barrel domain